MQYFLMFNISGGLQLQYLFNCQCFLFKFMFFLMPVFPFLVQNFVVNAKF